MAGLLLAVFVCSGGRWRRTADAGRKRVGMRGGASLAGVCWGAHGAGLGKPGFRACCVLTAACDARRAATASRVCAWAPSDRHSPVGSPSPRSCESHNFAARDFASLRRLRGGGDEDLSRPTHAHLDLKSPITYITDCKDENGKGRLKARLATLFPGCSVQFVGVSSDYEAALNLVDIVDAYDGRPGIVLANVARREGSERKNKWTNGPPFAWVKLENIDIFTTVDGYVVSLLQRMLERPLKMEVYDIPATVPHMGLSEERQAQVSAPP
jgi:hypothetical protein